MFMHIARLRISEKTALILTNVIHYFDDAYEKTTGIHLKFVYLVKLLSNCYATLSPKSLKNTSNFKS